MQFNVAQLLQEPIGATRIHELIDDISQLDPDLEALGPLIGHIQLMRTHSGVLVSGDLSTAIRVDCKRCLAPLVMPVRVELEESFHPSTEVQTGRILSDKDFQGSLEELDDTALLIDEHHILDISEVVRQHIWLGLPMVPGCNWEGPGECPNLLEQMRDIEGLEHGPGVEDVAETETIDPRWSALLALRDQGTQED